MIARSFIISCLSRGTSVLQSILRRFDIALFRGDGSAKTSHEASPGLGDALTLWRVDDTDDRWRKVGSVLLSAPNLRDGWNLSVVRFPDGEWQIGYANGAIGQAPPMTSLGIDTTADLSGSTFFGGVGWRGEDNTSNDFTDFGFDNFSVFSIPEPGTMLLVLASLPLLGRISRRRRRA